MFLKKIKFENNTRLQHLVLVFGTKCSTRNIFTYIIFFNYIGIYNLQILLCIRTKENENWCLSVI